MGVTSPCRWVHVDVGQEERLELSLHQRDGTAQGGARGGKGPTDSSLTIVHTLPKLQVSQWKVLGTVTERRRYFSHVFAKTTAALIGGMPRHSQSGPA
jgi:hypothetical protein